MTSVQRARCRMFAGDMGHGDVVERMLGYRHTQHLVLPEDNRCANGRAPLPPARIGLRSSWLLSPGSCRRTLSAALRPVQIPPPPPHTNDPTRAAQDEAETQPPTAQRQGRPGASRAEAAASAASSSSAGGRRRAIAEPEIVRSSFTRTEEEDEATKARRQAAAVLAAVSKDKAADSGAGSGSGSESSDDDDSDDEEVERRRERMRQLARQRLREQEEQEVGTGMGGGGRWETWRQESQCEQYEQLLLTRGDNTGRRRCCTRASRPVAVPGGTKGPRQRRRLEQRRERQQRQRGRVGEVGCSVRVRLLRWKGPHTDHGLSPPTPSRHECSESEEEDDLPVLKPVFVRKCVLSRVSRVSRISRISRMSQPAVAFASSFSYALPSPGRIARLSRTKTSCSARRRSVLKSSGSASKVYFGRGVSPNTTPPYTQLPRELTPVCPVLQRVLRRPRSLWSRR